MPGEKKPAKEVLREIVDRVYQNAWEAKKRGEPVGWSSSKFPAEIAETLGLASLLSGKPGGGYCGEAWRPADVRDFRIHGLCKRHLRLCKNQPCLCRGAESAEKPMPQPDFLLCCNNICNCMTKWYENIARMHKIPLIMIDVPYNNSEEVPTTMSPIFGGSSTRRSGSWRKSAAENGMRSGSGRSA
jgi:benzoyl-CoA reductase/2-hydroxyglutaryl-CoA dehydratase subunit BcrC/BadD/HgdB